VRPASAASTKSRTLSLRRHTKKNHLRPPRLSRSTRRPAIDSRRAHGVNESAIRHAVPRLHSQPAGINFRNAIPATASNLVLRCVHFGCVPKRRISKSALNALNIPSPDFSDYPILARKLRKREPKSPRTKSSSPPNWSHLVPVPSPPKMFTL